MVILQLREPIPQARNGSRMPGLRSEVARLVRVVLKIEELSAIDFG